MIDEFITKVGAAVRAFFLSTFNVDWFWLDFAGYAGIVLAIIVILYVLVRFLPESVKPVALAIVTGGLTFLWGYWKRHSDEKKRPKPVPVKPVPPKRNDGGWRW